eukprot:scaffold5136_cov66-Phaeocystis_antarctica.AAC.2
MNRAVGHFVPRTCDKAAATMMSLQLDMRAHCEVSRVQGEGGAPTLSNGGTWRAGATLMAALAWTL